MTTNSEQNSLDVDALRIELSGSRDSAHKSQFGQFLTPQSVAEFMASMFSPVTSPVRLLDPGCGHGALSYAFASRFKGTPLEIEGWEIDTTIHKDLSTVTGAAMADSATFQLHTTDFIKDGVLRHLTKNVPLFTHAILNPPYMKISTSSETRRMLKDVGVSCVNLYVAFLAISILLTKKGGEIVSITPRSFFNGSYYHPFRTFLLNLCSIDRIHLFDSRKKAFRDDNVLQENVILKLTRGRKQSDVVVSRSLDQTFTDYFETTHPFTEVVFPDDPQIYIHVPHSKADPEKKLSTLPNSKLSDLDLDICTGPVVDFRLREFCLDEESGSCAPLIYPLHFRGEGFSHPRTSKKPNWIAINDSTKKWLMESGAFVVTKRFTSKEEKRRVVAHVITQDQIKNSLVGFENHLNVYHRRKQGLPLALAHGLANYLNSPEVDEYFRSFSGHTQVNATDLRRLPYPSLNELLKLGRVSATQSSEPIKKDST